MQFTDSHCHLDFNEFSRDIPLLISQCQDNNIHRIIVPSVNPEHWQRVLSLSNNEYQNSPKKPFTIDCCLGIHPWFLIVKDKLSPKNLSLDFHQKNLADLVSINRKNIVAIGETGIDFFKAKRNTGDEQALSENLQLQQDFFDMQLTLAHEHDLPIIVHHCQSHQYIMPLLKKHLLAKGGVIHAFSGSYEQAKAYIDLGFKIGIGGTITYERAKKTISAVKRLPLESLLLETDAPSMPPSGQQGLINSPLNIIAVFNALSQIRTEPAQELAQQIEKNVEALFYPKVN